MKYCPECSSPLVERVVDGFQRQACCHCHFVHWNNPTPVITGILEYENRVLLLRPRQAPIHHFSLPETYLAHEETPEQAIIRKVSDSLGLNPTIRNFVGHYSCFRRNTLILGYYLEAEGSLYPDKDVSDIRNIGRENLYNLPFEHAPWTQDMVRDWYNQQYWRQVA